MSVRTTVLALSLVVAGLVFAAPRVVGEEPKPAPKGPEYKSCGDFRFVVQVAGQVEVFDICAIGETKGLAWNSQVGLEKIAPDLWAGRIALPNVAGVEKVEDHSIRLDFLIKRSTRREWVSLTRRCESFYSIRADELLGPNARKGGPSPKIDVLIEYQIDNADDYTEINQSTHWLVEGMPIITPLTALGGGRFLCHAPGMWEINDDYSTLKVNLEYVHKDGTSTKTGWKLLKEVNAKVLKISNRP